MIKRDIYFGQIHQSFEFDLFSSALPTAFLPIKIFRRKVGIEKKTI